MPHQPLGGDAGPLGSEGQGLSSLGQKAARKAAGATPGGAALLTGPGLPAPLPSSRCLFQIRLQNASPPPSCWHFIPQASSPSYLEGLRTHLPGANTQEGVAWLPAMARNRPSDRPGRRTSSACPRQPALPPQRRPEAPAWACPCCPPTSQPQDSPS